MSTSTPITAPSIPMPGSTAESNYQSILAIKQNIEISQGTRGIVRASQIHGPTVVNTQIGAALRQVDNA
jgi:hypothetical protein